MNFTISLMDFSAGAGGDASGLSRENRRCLTLRLYYIRCFEVFLLWRRSGTTRGKNARAVKPIVVGRVDVSIGIEVE